jgi:DNA invertase Pin-like site-specific DNA recombinase
MTQRTVTKKAPTNSFFSVVSNAEFPKERDGLIYVRQSSLTQVQNNIHSFEMQTEKFLEHFRNLGCTGHIDIIADDEAMSGTLDIHQRPGMTKMVKLIEQGAVGWIGAVHVNRFTRDKWLITPGVLMKLCYDHDVWIATLRMYFNFKDPYCQRVFMIEAEEAARHLEWMKLVLGGGKHAASDHGYYDGRFLSPGYIVDRTDPKRKKYIMYWPHAERVIWLFRCFLELDGNLPELTREVERMPYLFPKFEHWVDKRDVRRLIMKKTEDGNYKPTKDGIISILTNPVYLGWWLPLGGGVIEDNHEPLIEEALFTFAHKRLSVYNLYGERQKPERVIRNGKVQALLKKVIRSTDGTFIYPSSERGGLYRSASENGYRTTYNFCVSAALIDLAFLEKFFEHARTLPQICADWEDKSEDTRLAKAEREKLIRKQIKQAAEQLQEIKDTCNTPGCPRSMKELLFKEYEGLERKKAQLEQDVLNNSPDDEEIIFEIATLVPQILVAWDSLPFDTRMRFVGALTQSVILDHVAPGWIKIEITWKLEAWGRDIGHIRRIANRGSWTDEEDETLAGMYATEDQAAIIHALPHRSWRAMKARAFDLGLHRPKGMQIRNSIDANKQFLDVSLKDIEYAQEHQLDTSDKNVQWSSQKRCGKRS